MKWNKTCHRKSKKKKKLKAENLPIRFLLDRIFHDPKRGLIWLVDERFAGRTA